MMHRSWWAMSALWSLSMCVGPVSAGPVPPPAASRPAAANVAVASRQVKPKPRRTDAFIFLAPVRASPSGDPLARVIEQLAASRLDALEEVKTKSHRQMPEVTTALAQYGELTKLDRVSLIAIKNRTGFDGVVQLAYRYEGTNVVLALRCVDFRNGEVFADQTISRPVGAELFAEVQRRLIDFASRIRRSYRVTLELTSQPTGAVVRVNGEKVGRTPMMHELRSGSYKVRIGKKGYRAYERRFELSNGDTLAINAVLYNPIAAWFLNAEPGLRVDSRQLNLGYRYVFLGAADVAADHAHLGSIEGLLRIWQLDLGLRFAAGGFDSSETLDSFAGSDMGRNDQRHRLIQIQGVAKWILWEKFSFASLRLAFSPGMTHASSKSGDDSLSLWSFSGDAYLQLVSRIVRSKNVNIELSAVLGLSYLGRLPQRVRGVSVFGPAAERNKTTHLMGPLAGIGLRFSFYNGIF